VNREETLRALVSRNPGESLNACAGLLKSEDAGERIRVSGVTLSVETDQCVALLEIGSGSIEVRCSPMDLATALVSGTSVEFFLLRRLVDGILLPAGVAEEPLLRSNEDHTFELDPSYAVSDRAYAVVQAAQSGRDVMLIGPSSSGKSIAARQAARLLTESGASLIWADLSGHALGTTGMAKAILRVTAGPGRRTIVVLDDLQSDPQRAIALARLISGLRVRFTLPISVIATGWPSAASLADELALNRPIRLSCSSSEILTQMLATEYAPQAGFRDQVEMLARGDLLVAHAALDYIRSSGKVPSREQLAKYVVELRGDIAELTPEGRHLLYWLSCLGMHEVEVERDAASRIAANHGNTDAVAELVENKWARNRGAYLSVGHRSLAAQIASLLRSDFEADVWESSPTQLTVSYLRSVGDAQIRNTLDRLDLSSHGAVVPADQHGSGFLARCWTSLRVLVTVMERLGHEDPTWGDNTASAIFAAKTLSEFSSTALAGEIVGYVRTRWDYGDGRTLPRNAGSATADRIDFDEIWKAMQDEESMIEVSRESANSLDLDRFHQTWALGLLLGLESDPMLGDDERLSTLVSAASTCQSPDGSFYPSRVPWITARVVLGLVAAGQSVHTSATVRRACAWLRRAEPEGPFDFGSWRSGTGVWNSEAMTTAMCVLALVRAGIETSDVAVSTGLRFLLASRPSWLAIGNEIDGALAVETAIRMSMNWREYHDELTGLLSWARDQAVWAQAAQLASHSHTESSKVPFVASSLVEIIWTIVRSELPLILEGLGAEVVPAAEDPFNDGAAVPSTQRPSGTGLREVVSNLVTRATRRLGRNSSAVITGVSPEEARLFGEYVAALAGRIDHAQGYEVKGGASAQEIVLTVGLLEELRRMINT